MTYILNNVAANTALLNLENTVSNLQNVQNQISTGLAVSSAADNASYFSIASVLRSDSSALTTVGSTLNEGNSSLSLAANALSQVQTSLSDIKQQLINASVPGADRKVIQQQISQDQAQLQNIANSANFNGENFLSVELFAEWLQLHEKLCVVLFPRLDRQHFYRVHQRRYDEDRIVRQRYGFLR